MSEQRELKVGDKVIGEVWIGGEGHKAQAIDINQYGHGLIEAGEDLLQYWSSLDPEDLDDEVFRAAEELGIDISRPERGTDEDDARRAAERAAR